MDTVAGIRTGHWAPRWDAAGPAAERAAPGRGSAPAELSPRTVNARRVLEAAWDGEALTASDIMERTGLTRATVLSVCRDLVTAGWLREVADARAAGLYAKGRPALRYGFVHGSRLVVGVDAGQHSLVASVADLHGNQLGRVKRASDPAATAERRRTDLRDLVGAAIAEAGVDRDAVAAVVIGAPAPVDRDGRSPSDAADNFWPRMNPDFVTVFADEPWDVVVDNDANLAAIAEAAAGADDGVRAFATLLSGERFGAGIVVDGMLLRGSHGGVGEMRVLDMVSGVEHPHGLAQRARAAIREAPADRLARSALGNLGRAEIEAHHVFAAARCGDPFAREIVDGLAERLAPVVMLLSGLLDLDRIIIAGAVAESVEPVLQRTREIVNQDATLSKAELVASRHGNDVVLRGAVEAAIGLVRAGAMRPQPASAGTRPEHDGAAHPVG
ncbi:ROK family transcriptional regulator [Zhihengliuella salsuginis]|uniref:Transcriptional regulator n=1 Tax=Zhihengliuella salsuginis TaxID=578222 RepID=A0ABQ3GJ28_9MICC|nr:ROK family transcriptional regulator [Zhihengliuella salsuginis]GHD09927.1 transcriptional regulator [Zhihengliuella salsuginis]